MTIESHPLPPFLSHDARMLFLGSFPPPKARWSMDFFYPNWINDFWRVMGLIFFDDRNYFEIKGEKRFDKQRIISFAFEQRLAFFDTATKVQRLKDNASDNYLSIIEPTDIGVLLAQMPDCTRLITTGSKASELLQQQLTLASGMDMAHPIALPAIGSSTKVHAFNRDLEWFRMPSTSRAYPLALDKKAVFYRRLFE
ncbi:MAG: uracil-DNA glycosylase family protein [Bacteroidales bacterium]|nr:uracil-DNA glycosylase family protein [Bacteroidales bacterium]